MTLGGPPTQLARQLSAESKFQSLTRVGFFGRGILYILIALLVLRTGRTEDLTGALTYLDEGAGRLLLMGIAAGLFTYGLWRLADAAFGIDNQGAGNKVLAKRAAAGVVGFIYLYLSYKAARILLADGVGGGGQGDTVVDLPGGHLTLVFVAIVLAVAGVTQLVISKKCGFLRRLDGRAQLPAVKWLGRLGYAARGVIFLIVAYLFAQAALDGRSNARAGTEQALDFMSGPVLYAVAVGLMLFGAFSIVEALFRRIHEPPDDMVGRMREKVGG